MGIVSTPMVAAATGLGENPRESMGVEKSGKRETWESQISGVRPGSTVSPFALSKPGETGALDRVVTRGWGGESSQSRGGGNQEDSVPEVGDGGVERVKGRGHATHLKAWQWPHRGQWMPWWECSQESSGQGGRGRGCSV